MKTFNIALDELKTGCIKLVNDCQLPPAIIAMVLTDVAEKCNTVAKAQLDAERKAAENEAAEAAARQAESDVVCESYPVEKEA